MKVIFLAAGAGERMKPYSDIMEKCMLPLGGKPVIRITVECLLASKVVEPEDVTISVLPCNKDIFLHEFRDLPVNIRTIANSPNTATHFYLVSRRDKIDPDEDIMIHYADNISAIDYRKFYDEYHSAVEWTDDIYCCIAGTLLIKHDYSAIRITSKMDQYLQHYDTRSIFDRVKAFVEKPYLGERGWMGVAIFKNSKMMDIIYRVMQEKGTDSVDFGYDILPPFAKEGHVILYKHEGEWFDVGNVTSYMKLRKRIAAGEKIV